MGFGVLAALLLATAVHAAPPWTGPMGPIQKFVETFNRGDSTAAMTTHARTADLVIMDSAPPFSWHGPEAFRMWSAALSAHESDQGMTNPVLTLRAPLRMEVNGDRAYVVLPAIYSYNQRGSAMREEAHMTFVVGKSGEDWLIQGWAWSGTNPKRAGSARQ